ncbi:MAG TPA: NAD(P)/FAD-dependent oxidoreductase [Anaerolineaceae bacterium]|nr:NAD(P)/FAD-dependent oxidoreductase [Anaerolineaceae bacterium]
METGNKKIVIVGAGMAGLTAAAYLSRKNFGVLLLDKNDRTGGLLGTFERDGFYFDSGPRAFVNSGIVKPMFKDLGIHWDFLENRISIGIEDQLFQVNAMDDLQKYKQILIHLYPENEDDIGKIISYIYQLSGYNKVLYEFDNPNFGDVMSDKKFIFIKLIPWTFKFLYALSKFNQFNMPMEVFLQSLSENQSLIDILTQHFFRKTPTYFALGYFYVYLDYFYPMGGTGALDHLLKEKILSWCGDIKLNKHIVEVIPSESKLIDSEGCCYPYDHLIWAADLKTLYRCLNPIGLDTKTTRRIESEAHQILSSKGAESIFILFIAVNRPPSYFQENGGAHVFYTPSKQGLGETNRQERQCLIEDFDKKSKIEILDWLKKYIKLNTYEISVPVLRDGSMAPEGQTGLMISCLFDYDVMVKVEKAGWYDEFKKTMENQIIDMFSQTIYKNMDEDILFKFSSTPLTINKVSGSSEGAITGWSFETKPPVVNQLKDIPKSVFTPVPNIYQAGQWAYSPAGVPIAMLTGWYATQEIMKQSKKRLKR